MVGGGEGELAADVCALSIDVGFRLFEQRADATELISFEDELDDVTL